MAKSIQVLGAVVGLQGVGGVLDGLGVGLFHGFLVQHLPLARDYPLFAGIALVVIGTVMVIAGDRSASRDSRT